MCELVHFKELVFFGSWFLGLLSLGLLVSWSLGLVPRVVGFLCWPQLRLVLFRCNAHGFQRGLNEFFALAFGGHGDFYSCRAELNQRMSNK